MKGESSGRLLAMESGLDDVEVVTEALLGEEAAWPAKGVTIRR